MERCPLSQAFLQAAQPSREWYGHESAGRPASAAEAPATYAFWNR